MPNSLTVRLQGADEIERRLRQLGEDVSVSEMRGALEQSAGPVVSDAKRRTTSRAVRAEVDVLGSGVSATSAEVTVAVGLPKKGRSFMGLWIERGTGPRVQKKTGRRTGSMPARPFLLPALTSQKDAVVARFGAEMWKRIAKHGGP